MFSGTSPGEFDDVKEVKITIVAKGTNKVKVKNFILEICHYPGIFLPIFNSTQYFYSFNVFIKSYK